MPDWDHDDDDDDKSRPQGVKSRRDEWDCPACNANNPVGDGFGHNDELRCNYCGLDFKVVVNPEGKFRFKEL